MTAVQKSKCHKIIHTSAGKAAGGNVVPILGLGTSVDLAVLAAMAIALAAVFGQNLTAAAARGVAYGALKDTIMKQPVKSLTKECAKYLPIFGTAVAATVSFGLAEAAGWQLAGEFEGKAATIGCHGVS